MRLLHFYERKPLPACIFVTSQPQNNPGYGTNERGCSSANRDKKLDFSELCGAITGFGTQGSQVLAYSGSRRDAPPQRNNLGFLSQVEYWKIRPNSLRDIARRQVCVMLLRHAGVCVAELSCNDAHRNAFHRQM